MHFLSISNSIGWALSADASVSGISVSADAVGSVPDLAGSASVLAAVGTVGDVTELAVAVVGLHVQHEGVLAVPQADAVGGGEAGIADTGAFVGVGRGVGIASDAFKLIGNKN